MQTIGKMDCLRSLWNSVCSLEAFCEAFQISEDTEFINAEKKELCFDGRLGIGRNYKRPQRFFRDVKGKATLLICNPFIKMVRPHGDNEFGKAIPLFPP